MDTKARQPFKYNNTEEFKEGLLDWIGDVLYDIFPENSYEVRDEQIFTAFQIADAINTGEVHLAEAGLGTGKTFAYLLSAIPYARFTGKPVIIACASSALQEQLAGETGDIAALSKLLGLEIDARMAKDPRQYICDVNVEAYTSDFSEGADEINQWMSKTTLGERSEIPEVPDRVWNKIAWNESMDCETCEKRGYCKLVKAREYYRVTKDLIVVDHETFFADLWTREDRILNGKLPILPSYSAVVFDEGHKIMLPAAMQAGYSINKEEVDQIIACYEEVQGVRDSLMSSILKLKKASYTFFKILGQSVNIQGNSERLSIRMSGTLLTASKVFRDTLDHLLLELQIEQELYFESLPQSLIQAYEGQIERAILALDRFTRNQGKGIIPWVNRRTKSFWVVPRDLGELLNRHLFQKKMPVIFTSATLSNKGDFDYISRTLGLQKPSKSSVGSPFDTEKQVSVYVAKTWESIEEKYVQGIEHLVQLLKNNQGKALILTNSVGEVRKIRKELEGYEFPFEILWEDKADRGYLVRRFREEESTVLVGSNFWEGIDVPGEALTLLVIWKLPFPASDPLIDVQREEAKKQGINPIKAVDFPEMGLKLKQGCGRLIRKEDDKGNIVILDSVKGKPWEKVVLGALPITTGIRNINEIL